MEKMKVVVEKKAKEDRARLEAEVIFTVLMLHLCHANVWLLAMWLLLFPRKAA
jgi:hypothetical protein